jgi:AcrR family transcriptional regulator
MKSDLRDEAKQRTRQRIVGAATSAFAEKGFRSVTMSHIATRARIGRATLYLHFSNKTEIADEIARAIRPRMVAVVMTLPDIRFDQPGLERWVAAIVAELRRFGAVATVANEAFGRDPELTDVFVKSMRDIASEIADGLKPQRRWPAKLGEGGLAMLLTATMLVATTVFGGGARAEEARSIRDLARLWRTALT